MEELKIQDSREIRAGRELMEPGRSKYKKTKARAEP